MQPEDWNDLRVFIAVARAGQIANAAKMINVDPTTIGRRLRRLEQALGTRLVEQTREGQVLTEPGEELLSKVELMAETAASVFDVAKDHHGLSGQIRLSVSEGFGSWFLAEKLPELIVAHPELAVELVASSGFLSPSKREADIAIMLSRPKSGALISRKLSDYGLMLYASPTYLAENGTPSTAECLTSGHRLVGYISDLLYAPELDYWAEVHPELRATVRSSSINAQLHLIASGAGIGILPAFMGDRYQGLERVIPEIGIRRTFWIVTHQDNHRLAKVRHLSSWLAEQAEVHRSSLCPA